MEGKVGSEPGVLARTYGDLVRLTGVHKYYGGGLPGVHALRGIDLTVGQGEIVAVCGPSGSGKTSLLHLIGMLEAATEGSVVIAGLLAGKLSEQARADLRAEMIGSVFQAYTLVPVLSARDNVLLPLLLRAPQQAADMLAARARADELLGLLGMATQADHLPVHLDASQSQRVAIARALIGKPRLVLADEPASRLDSGGVRQMMELFAREQGANGTTFILTTRDQRQLSRVTRTLQLAEGRLLATPTSTNRTPSRIQP